MTQEKDKTKQLEDLGIHISNNRNGNYIYNELNFLDIKKTLERCRKEMKEEMIKEFEKLKFRLYHTARDKPFSYDRVFKQELQKLRSEE